MVRSLAMTQPSPIALVRRVVLVHDLHGYTRASSEKGPLALARFLDAYYRAAATAIVGEGGRVVKHIGDAVLAVFPEERADEAVDCAIALRASVAPLAITHGIAVTAGSACVHIADVAEGVLGEGAAACLDVIGAGVNETFLLGQRRGAGVHVSGNLYALLSSEHRAGLTEHEGVAVYSRK
jgi:adenylate cyclase